MTLLPGKILTSGEAQEIGLGDFALNLAGKSLIPGIYRFYLIAYSDESALVTEESIYLRVEGG